MSNWLQLASDGYECPTVCTRFHWKSKALACSRRNKFRPGTTGINQDSHHKGIAFTVLGEAHSGWVLVAVIGLVLIAITSEARVMPYCTNIEMTNLIRWNPRWEP